MGAVFVTATGTDIGKTFVTAGLIRHLRSAGRSVAALKPVMSGYDPAAAADSDAGALLRALGWPVDAGEIARIAPWRYRAPLSPDMAAAREGQTLDVDALIAFSRAAIGAAPDAVLIEGVGGVMVPLDGTRTVRDWMAVLGIPLLLVTGSYLGTLSHTLTALDALASAGLQVRAVAVSESAGSTVALDETVATLRRFAGNIPVIALPRLAGPAAPHPAFAQIAAALGL